MKRSSRCVRSQHLHRDRLAKLAVNALCQVHGAHPARAQKPNGSIMPVNMRLGGVRGCKLRRRCLFVGRHEFQCVSPVPRRLRSSELPPRTADRGQSSASKPEAGPPPPPRYSRERYAIRRPSLFRGSTASIWSRSRSKSIICGPSRDIGAQLHPRLPAAALQAMTMAGVAHQNAPHRLGRESKEVRPVLKSSRLPQQHKKQLVHQSGRFEAVACKPAESTHPPRPNRPATSVLKAR